MTTLTTPAAAYTLHAGPYCAVCHGDRTVPTPGEDADCRACQSVEGDEDGLVCDVHGQPCGECGEYLRHGAYVRDGRALCLRCAALEVAEAVDPDDDSAEGRRSATLALLHAHGAGEWPVGAVLAALGLRRVRAGANRLVLGPLTPTTVLDLVDYHSGARVLIGVTDGEIRAWLADCGAMSGRAA